MVRTKHLGSRRLLGLGSRARFVQESRGPVQVRSPQFLLDTQCFRCLSKYTRYSRWKSSKEPQTKMGSALPMSLHMMRASRRTFASVPPLAICPCLGTCPCAQQNMCRVQEMQAPCSLKRLSTRSCSSSCHTGEISRVTWTALQVLKLALAEGMSSTSLLRFCSFS